MWRDKYNSWCIISSIHSGGPLIREMGGKDKKTKRRSLLVHHSSEIHRASWLLPLSVKLDVSSWKHTSRPIHEDGSRKVWLTLDILPWVSRTENKVSLVLYCLNSHSAQSQPAIFTKGSARLHLSCLVGLIPASSLGSSCLAWTRAKRALLQRRR